MTAIRHGWTEHHWVWQETSHAEGVRVTSYLCECGKTKKVVTVLKKRVKKQPDAHPKPPRKPQNRLSRPRHSKPAKKGKVSPESKCGRKTRLKPVSDEKARWNRLYREKVQNQPLVGVIWDCEGKDGEFRLIRRVGFLLEAERHHVLGRQGPRILFWANVTHRLHTFAHDKAKRARELGILLPEFSGNRSNEDTKDPFGILPLYWKYLQENP